MIDPKDKLLTAADCAARTGLTTRALRLYERYGLLTPRRTGGGWRQYGRRELIRLNTVCVLKAAGLTLAQIRTAIGQNNPPLQEALQAQIASWETKKAQAERGQRIAEAALRHLQANQALSIDQLCELIQAHEGTGTNPAVRDLFRRLERMPLRKRRAWANGHNEDLNPKWAQRFQEAVRRRIDPQLERVMDAGESPSSPRVQRLIKRHLCLMKEYGVRQSTISWLTSDSSHGSTNTHDGGTSLKHQMLGRIRSQMKKRPTESSDLISGQWTANPFLVGYFSEAERLSEQCRDLDKTLLEARATVRSHIQPGSPEGHALAKRLAQICRKHSLGNPLTYAQWAAIARPPPSDMTEAEDEKLWSFMAAALSAASGRRSRRATGIESSC